MKYIVEQLLDPNDTDMASVLNLFKGIPGRTCSAANYLKYLSTNWLTVALFTCKVGGEIVGFTQAEAPGTLDPTSAWLPFSHATPQCPHRASQEAVELAKEWMRGFGALKFKVATIRSPDAFGRLWNMKRSDEVLMEQEL